VTGITAVEALLKMDLLDLNGYNLRGLARKNLILGKNGCGKSHLLKRVEQALLGRNEMGAVRYLSPERGGVLQYEAGIEQNLTNDPNWLAGTRRQNQAHQFRQQSAAQFRRLELLILRDIEQNPASRKDYTITFDRTVDRINKLLDRVLITRGDRSFAITDRASGGPVQPEAISSGESELISLGIECLVFEKECQPDKSNLLLIDEPDVHLHPDLQARFAKFIEELLSSGPASVLIATHSTALLGAMSEDDQTRVAFMRFGDMDIAFSPTTDTHKKVLPVFGAHPLSNVFNQAPVLLVEGEDDERVWQQAVRSAKGRIKVYPCAVDGVSELKPFEQEVAKIIQAVYDDGIGFSLRDRDLDPTEINDVGPIKRMRLHCRTAENLLVSDEVLNKLAVGWDELLRRIKEWLANNPGHPHHSAMKKFADDGFDRTNADLKDIRNDLVGLMGSNKPWEVIVGQVIAATEAPPPQNATSIVAFLGKDVCQNLLNLTISQPVAHQAAS
jgi:energy-coupling factor transporter ATP-binding protein EcfA2